MGADAQWDRFFGAFGGRVFTIGALLIAVAVGAIMIVVAPELFGAPRDFAGTHHGDIDAFIRAGDMALAGEAARAYDAAAFTAPFSDANRGLLWFYPPHAFFAAAPLGAAPFVAVRPLWIALTIVSMFAVIRIAKLRGPLAVAIIAASPAMFVSLYFLQVGAFVALGLAASLLLAPARPLVAGVILGVMTIKPQYGLLIPVFLAATGQWRVFAAAAATAVALVLLSVAVFGVAAWTAYFESIPRDQAAFFALPQPATASIGQLAVKLGAAPVVAIGAQLVALGVAAATTFMAARALDYRLAAGLVALLSLAAAPSSWTYDWPIVAAGLVMIAAARTPWPAPVQGIALLAWVAPFAHLFAANGLVAPLALLALSAAFVAWSLAPARRQARETT